MDVLSEVLRVVRLQGALFYNYPAFGTLTVRSASARRDKWKVGTRMISNVCQLENWAIPPCFFSD